MTAPLRFTRDRPCPICGGHDGATRGLGERCHGYQLSADDGFARCTREEHAGALDQNDDGTFSHRLAGPCRCGREHGETERGELELRHEIRDAEGQLLAVHCRRGSGEGKRVWWEGPDGRAGLNGGRPADWLYRAEELASADREAPVVVCEGETAASALASLGIVAVGTVTGAGTPQAPKAISPAAACLLAGWHVVLWPDNDQVGELHMRACAAVLRDAGARSISLAHWLEAPPKGDAADLCSGFPRADALDKVHEIIRARQQIDASVNGVAPPEAEAPVVRFVPLGDYVANPKGSPEALLGEGDDVEIPVGGLLMAYGDAGAGKTTLNVDAVAHMASGTDWLGISIQRPVKIALIQNEGPAEPWRRKLERKLAAWEGPDWSPNVLVLDEPHGGFDFRIPEHREALRELRRQGVELVIADPTKWLGMEGGGTPSEVRDFVALLKECGLHAGDPERAMAFWLAHHENVAGEISGAWRADPDTVVHVEPDGKGRTKLTWTKCRWSSGRHGQLMILAHTEHEGFEVVDIPGPRQQVDADELDRLVLTYLLDQPEKVATSTVRDAIEARGKDVDEALERLKNRGQADDFERDGRPHLGRPRTARYWKASPGAGLEVVRTSGTTSDDRDFGPITGDEVVRVVPPIERDDLRTTTDGTTSRLDEPLADLASWRDHLAGDERGLS